MLAALSTALSRPSPAAAEPPPEPQYAASAPTYGALYRDGQTDRWLLGGAWLFRADPADQGLAQGWWRDIADPTGWSGVTVPNSYNAGDLSSSSMAGSVGWYRRDFLIPSGAFPTAVPAWAARWIVRFESVNYHATVWLNGRPIGSHDGAYLPFELDLAGLRPGVNRLIVRVDDRRDGSALPPGPGGGWWNFGGIQREVYLRAVARADIQSVMVRPLLPCASCPATVQEQAVIRNPTGRPQAVRLFGFYGGVPLNFGAATIPAHGSWTAGASLILPHPTLWSPEDPYLYRATLTLRDPHGNMLGRYITYSGVRSITVTADGRMELNGRLLNLRGVNLHEQDSALGAALDPAHLQALVGRARELGATLLRAHYPLNPQIAELADRDGLLLWSEIPVYQVGGQYLATPAWLSFAYGELRENIAVNQNHPSVLLWSIGNELATPVGAPEADYIAGAAALAHQLDPTRPVGLAIYSWPGVPCQNAYAPLDVIGLNEYFGWFGYGGGATDDRDGLGPFLDYLRGCYPGKALMVSEFGFDANRHGPVEERGTYEFQANSIVYHLGVFDARPWLAGAIYFAMQDFAARPGWSGGNPWGDPPYVRKGFVDEHGDLKPNFGLMASLYGAKKQIGPAREATHPASRSGTGAASRSP